MPGGVWAELAELVLPADCAGCRRPAPLRRGVCADCAAGLAALRPRPVRPDPPPAGLPRCVAAGPYAGALRELLLAYKERGRHGLARPLGDLLARVVAEAVGGPVLLVPVPSTARAARARYGDHLTRLTRHAEAGLRRAGRSVVVARPVRAVPRPDSAGLDSAARAALAAGAFQPRAGGMARLPSVASGRSVVLLDDIVTTGATLAGLSRILAGGGVRVDAAAVLAGTVRRHPG